MTENTVKIERINWTDTLALRQKILWPGKPQAFCRVQGDEQARHYGVFADKALLGVASTYDAEGLVRLRKFAVETACQGGGYGSALLARILALEKARGSRSLWCDARESAVGFYARFDLQATGDVFYKSGVAYRRMSITWQVE